MRRVPSTPRKSRRPGRGSLVLLVVAGALIAASPAAGAKPPAANPAVVNTWNAIAVSTITAAPPDGVGANAESFSNFAYVQAAVYNAVVGITRKYELYHWQAKAPKRASPEAAAAAAAHGVLMAYFGDSPTVAANLDAALVTSLEQIPNGVSKRRGIRYGERAADRIVQLREDDGRFAPITFERAPLPGVWRPTPPALAPFFDPWLGQLDPFVLDSLDQLRPGPPPPIGSALYLQEWEEVRDYGVSTNSLRTNDQTETARFFSDTAGGPLQSAIRDLAMRRKLDISDTARYFAAVDLSIADAIGVVWDAKYFYGWWRPITAIREADTDGDPNTAGVSGWTPFLTTPPYPDWPSGLCSVIGAASRALERLNADGTVDLTITSAAAGVTRHYDDEVVMQLDAIDARVWSGIHFRTADEVGASLGRQAANWALDHFFAPTH